MTERIIERISYLDAERLDIKAAMKRATDMQIFRWLSRRLKRNERTVEVLYELLGAEKYEKA